MSILVDERTRVLVQGITGTVGSSDTKLCLEYGTNIVSGVTPGRGGAVVSGVPVFARVAEAVVATGATASVIYAPMRAATDAALEAIDCGLSPIVGIAEDLPRHDAARAVEAARDAGVVLIGFNTNGVISPGKTKLGGIGGSRAAGLFPAGRIGVCSRSGGMSAEIGAALARAGLGVSTCVSMGGEAITGRSMVEYVLMFETDADTDAVVVFGEPGSGNEAGLAAALSAGEITKPVVAMVVGDFLDAYEPGKTFGHVAAIASVDEERAATKRRLLHEAGALIAERVEDVPVLLRAAMSEART